VLVSTILRLSALAPISKSATSLTSTSLVYVPLRHLQVAAFPQFVSLKVRAKDKDAALFYMLKEFIPAGTIHHSYAQ